MAIFSELKIADFPGLCVASLSPCANSLAHCIKAIAHQYRINHIRGILQKVL